MNEIQRCGAAAPSYLFDHSRPWHGSTEYARGYGHGFAREAEDTCLGLSFSDSDRISYRDGYRDGQDDKALDDGDGPTWVYVGWRTSLRAKP